MRTVSFQELQPDPDALLDRVEAGEQLVVPATRSDPRRVGLCAGAFTSPDDFDAPLPEEILREFEGQ